MFIAIFFWRSLRTSLPYVGLVAHSSGVPSFSSTRRKFIYTLVALVFFIFLLYLLHVPILRFFGNQLIYEDKLEKAPAMFVLSGDAWDRGNEAIRLYRQGYSDKIICTGENVPRLFLIAHVDYLESELTKMHLMNNGIPDSSILLIKKGTSTKEEADHILEYCRQHQLQKLIVISTKFHTRRIKNTFKKKFDDAGIHLIIHGAPSSGYDEMFWWKSENGLIFVNNEYIKILYYWLKRF